MGEGRLGGLLEEGQDGRVLEFLTVGSGPCTGPED